MPSRLFSYVVTHDTGFAPNPYGGILTLATCKPRIRATAQRGDWLLGTGSVHGVDAGRVVYAACIAEVVPLEQYATEARFAVKYPAAGKESWQRHGDNIYTRLPDGTWHQRRNIHHVAKDIPRDLSGTHVLVCERFWYFGSAAPLLPEALTVLVKRGPGHRCEDSPALVAALVSWLGTFTPGISGVPFMDTKSPRRSRETRHKQHTSPLARSVVER
jgi:Nucleotide modification associated domain 2